MGTASGIYKQVKYKVEATYGTVPAAASSQALRRVTSSLDLSLIHILACARAKLEQLDGP